MPGAPPSIGTAGLLLRSAPGSAASSRPGAGCSGRVGALDGLRLRLLRTEPGAARRAVALLDRARRGGALDGGPARAATHRRPDLGEPGGTGHVEGGLLHLEHPALDGVLRELR